MLCVDFTDIIIIIYTRGRKRRNKGEKEGVAW